MLRHPLDDAFLRALSDYGPVRSGFKFENVGLEVSTAFAFDRDFERAGFQLVRGMVS